jgi:hypothetical protein
VTPVIRPWVSKSIFSDISHRFHLSLFKKRPGIVAHIIFA